jgi:hypothetical protein
MHVGFSSAEVVCCDYFLLISLHGIISSPDCVCIACFVAIKRGSSLGLLFCLQIYQASCLRMLRSCAFVCGLLQLQSGLVNPNFINLKFTLS